MVDPEKANYYEEQMLSQSLVHTYYVIFDGSYKDGKKDGKGTQYVGKNLPEYSGEYKNDKYWGKGKKYYPLTNKLEYEGEFKYGHYNGKGTLYDENGNVKYSGKFKNGEIK